MKGARVFCIIAILGNTLYYIILFPNAKRDISHGRHKNICILREEKRKKEGVKKIIPQIGHTSLSGGGVL